MSVARSSEDVDRQFISASIWLSLTVLVGVAVVGCAWGSGLSVGFAPWQTGKFVLELTVAAGLAFACRRAAPRCAAAIGSFVVLTIVAAAAGTLSSVGQMFAFPLIDGALAAADELLGVRSIDVIRLIVQLRGGPPLLGMLYELATPMLFVTLFGLACFGRMPRIWEMCAAFSFCILVATVTSFLFPAAGAFEHAGIASAYGSHLPAGAGIYHLKSFHALRGSSALVIDPFALQGIVTFPSFHTAMALMTAAAWRDDPYLRGPMIIWNAGVILSTIPIGGHYIVDLIGGAATWLMIFRFGPAWADAIRSATRFSSFQPQPA